MFGWCQRASRREASASRLAWLPGKAGSPAGLLPFGQRSLSAQLRRPRPDLPGPLYVDSRRRLKTSQMRTGSSMSGVSACARESVPRIVRRRSYGDARGLVAPATSMRSRRRSLKAAVPFRAASRIPSDPRKAPSTALRPPPIDIGRQFLGGRRQRPEGRGGATAKAGGLGADSFVAHRRLRAPQCVRQFGDRLAPSADPPQAAQFSLSPRRKVTNHVVNAETVRAPSRGLGS